MSRQIFLNFYYSIRTAELCLSIYIYTYINIQLNKRTLSISIYIIKKSKKKKLIRYIDKIKKKKKRGEKKKYIYIYNLNWFCIWIYQKIINAYPKYHIIKFNWIKYKNKKKKIKFRLIKMYKKSSY